MTSRDLIWLTPPETLALSSDEVHIWRVSLDVNAVCLQRLRHTLAEDELSRAGRFCFWEDRQHFIVARGALRDILGRYLHIASGQLRFSYDAYGKPALISAPGDDALRFNVTHSHGLALYAVARGREVGIDLERIRAGVEYEEIARRFFSPRENAELRACPARMRLDAFFSGWTRKEAYLKARGDGLSIPLDQFEVSLAPDEPARLLKVSGDRSESFRWSLQELSPDPGYVAALAVEGCNWRLTCWQWQVQPQSVACCHS